MHNKSYFFESQYEKEQYEDWNHIIPLEIKKQLYKEIAKNTNMSVEELQISEMCIPSRDSITALVILAEAIQEVFIHIFNGPLIEGSCAVKIKNKEALIKDITIDEGFDEDVFDDVWHELIELAELMCGGGVTYKLETKPINNNQQEFYHIEKRAIECGYIIKGKYAEKTIGATLITFGMNI